VQDQGRGGERQKSDYLSEINAGSLKDWFVNSFLNYMEAGIIITVGNANYPAHHKQISYTKFYIEW
jgi:hypothetical protein